MIQTQTSRNGIDGIKRKEFVRGIITGSVISSITTIFLLLGIWILFLNHPTESQTVIYKEYSNVSELYKNAILGDRAKVTIMAGNPPNNATGSVNSVDGVGGVVFRIPQSQLNTIKLLPGRNIVYVLISERVQSTIICDIEKVAA